MCLRLVKGLYQSRLELNRVFGGRSMLLHVYNRGDSRMGIDLWRQKKKEKKSVSIRKQSSNVLPMASEYTFAASLNWPVDSKILALLMRGNKPGG